MNIIEILKKSSSAYKKRKAEEDDKKERKDIAKLFNDRYSFRMLYCDTGKNAWMCPDCNKIHLSNGCDFWAGITYQKCCSYNDEHLCCQDVRYK